MSFFTDELSLIRTRRNLIRVAVAVVAFLCAGYANSGALAQEMGVTRKLSENFTTVPGLPSCFIQEVETGDPTKGA